MQTIVRSILTTTTKQINVRGRTITFVGTKESPDRTGDIIRVDGWEFANFEKNPVFLWNHNPSIPPIGKVTKITRGDREVLFDVQFATAAVSEFADNVFKLFSEGFLSAVSVGFIPKDIEPIFAPNGDLVGLEILRQELLELSAVAIPAHQDALAASAYGEKLSKLYKNYLDDFTNEKLEKAVSLEEYRKQLPKFTEEESGVMTTEEKEQFTQLEEKVAGLEKDLASVISLRESVDLSVKSMDTLNKSVVAVLSKEAPAAPEVKSAAEMVGLKPETTLNLDKLMGALGTALTKIESAKTFKVTEKEGDK